MIDCSSVQGEAVFITGGKAGLGRGFSRRFAPASSRSAFAARHTERLGSVAKEIRSSGGRASLREVDIRAGRFGAVEEVVEIGFCPYTPAAAFINGGTQTIDGREWLSAKAASA